MFNKKDYTSKFCYCGRYEHAGHNDLDLTNYINYDRTPAKLPKELKPELKNMERGK